MALVTSRGPLGRLPPAARVPSRRWVLLAIAALLAAPHALSQAPPLNEYQVKAVFLYNFARFVEWPAAALDRGGDTFVIGILGEDPFGAALESTVRGEVIHDRRLVVRHFSSAGEAASGHIVFIGSPAGERFGPALAELARAGVLTVGDSERLAGPGVVISFRLEQNRVRFDVNLEAAERAGLKISSHLLKLARVARAGQRKGT